MLLLEKFLFSILKMIATSGFLTALECTKFVFGWGSTPDPAGSLQRSPRSPSWFKGDLLLRGRGGQWEGRGGERGEKGKEGYGREGFTPPPLRKFLDLPLFITRFISGFLTVCYGTVNTNDQSS